MAHSQQNPWKIKSSSEQEEGCQQCELSTGPEPWRRQSFGAVEIEQRGVVRETPEHHSNARETHSGSLATRLASYHHH